jgi:hypothetical protein
MTFSAKISERAGNLLPYCLYSVLKGCLRIAFTIASTHDVDTQSRTEIATEQIFIRRSKRVVKRPAEAGNDETLAAGSKRVTH